MNNLYFCCVKSKNINSRIFGWFAIAIFSLISLNNSIFLHAHKLDSGVIISHAHPFQKAKTNSTHEPNHSHNANELIFYKILNSILYTVCIAFCLITLVALLKSKCQHLYSFAKILFNKESLRIRPPPSLVY